MNDKERIAKLEARLRSANSFVQDWKADAKQLRAENKRLREALTKLAEGTTDWIDGYHAETWQCMAAFARETLETIND